MQINEIFSSFDGEGIRAGYLVTFIRTQFCNLKCSYCDTKYSLEAKDEEGRMQYCDMSIDEIIAACKMLGNKRVTLTGGEPLIQQEAFELVDRLMREGFEVNIETNGAQPIDQYVKQHNADMTKLIVTMDWKSPFSGMSDKMLISNLDLLRPCDVLKFVVANEEDLQDMLQVIEQNDLHCHIFVSPVFGNIQPFEIVEFLKKYNLQQVRLQLQLHKVVYPIDARGV